MNFNFGEWVVEAIKVISQNRHLLIMAYVLVISVLLRSVAALISAL